MSDDQKLPTVLPELSPHTAPDAEPTVAEQGPLPADFATRPVPPTPAPAGEHLSAEQVAALVGSDETADETNRDLNAAEGNAPGLTES